MRRKNMKFLSGTTSSDNNYFIKISAMKHDVL